MSTVAGREYTIETTNLGSACDTYIYLYDTDGVTEIDHDDDGGIGAASKIVWKCYYLSGDYYIRVRHFNSTSSGPHTNYDIEVSYTDIIFPQISNVALNA